MTVPYMTLNKTPNQIYDSFSNILHSFADDVMLIVGVSTVSCGALIIIGALTFFLVRRRNGYKPNENGIIRNVEKIYTNVILCFL